MNCQQCNTVLRANARFCSVCGARVVAAHINPYVGPRSFTEAEDDRKRFFGREREARDLLAQVVSERLVVFYAQSGAGKSSLINARLIPGLREEGFEVLPVGRVSGKVPQGIVPDNIFIFNFISRINDSLPAGQQHTAAALGSMTLPTFLGAEDVPVTDGSERAADATAHTYDTAPTVLIIDQFEEVFTTHLDQWQHRADFFQQLRAAQELFPSLWVVLAMREDYIARLDPFAYILPNRLHTRYYMQRMGRAAALEAVKKPAEQVGGRPFEPGVAETLVDNLRLAQSDWTDNGHAELAEGEFVEPVQLQVVCYQLWERLHHSSDMAAAPRQPSNDSASMLATLLGTSSPDRSTAGTEADVASVKPALALPPASMRTITAGDLQALAGDKGLVNFVNQALGDYYEQAIRKVLQTPEVDVSERELRDWFSTKLLTPEGTRGLVYQGSEAAGTGGIPNVAVRLLADQFLIRAEVRGGGTWYELVHDRFVQPILQANRAWLLAQTNPVTNATRLWLANNRDPERLLRGAQLADARRYAQEHPRALGEDEHVFLDASAQQQAAEVEREAAQQRGLAQAAQRLADEEKLRANAERQLREEQEQINKNLRKVRSYATVLAASFIGAIVFFILFVIGINSGARAPYASYILLAVVVAMLLLLLGLFVALGLLFTIVRPLLRRKPSAPIGSPEQPPS